MPNPVPKPSRILVIDVGGTHIKALATGHKNRIRFDSGPTMTPARMVKEVKKATEEWKYGRRFDRLSRSRDRRQACRESL